MINRTVVVIDCEIPEFYVESLRRNIENSAWEGVNEFRVQNPGVLKAVLIKLHDNQAVTP